MRPATSPIEPGETVMCFAAPPWTWIFADAVCPSDVAVIVALPASSPITTPLVLTVATSSSDDDQPTARPVSGFPDASIAWAASVMVTPEASDVESGVTSSSAIAAAEMLTTAVSPTPLALAMMRAVPVPAPVTTPDEETVA